MFLAADKTRLQDLDEAVRKYLAWESILAEKEMLDLSPHQVKQAETQIGAADATVTARLPETYQWLLVPEQKKPQDPIVWQSIRLTGQDGLAVRASEKLRSDELLFTSLAGTRLLLELDRVPLWRGNHVEVKQMVEDFARYPYLPRLMESTVLLDAVRDGVALLTWEQDTFAYADSFDEGAGRYRGLRAGQHVLLADSVDAGVVVRATIARAQLSADATTRTTPSDSTAQDGDDEAATKTNGDDSPESKPGAQRQPKRFHGTVPLDPTRVGRDAGRLADEVISHLVGLIGTDVTVTLEIAPSIPTGAPDHVVRTVTENSRTLKFVNNSGFEDE